MEYPKEMEKGRNKTPLGLRRNTKDTERQKPRQTYTYIHTHTHTHEGRSLRREAQT